MHAYKIYIGTYIHAYIHAYIHTNILHTYKRAQHCQLNSVRHIHSTTKLPGKSAKSCMHTYVNTCMYAYIQTPVKHIYSTTEFTWKACAMSRHVYERLMIRDTSSAPRFGQVCLVRIPGFSMKSWH